MLDKGCIWPHGKLGSVGTSRIGAQYGFSGEIYRITGASAGGLTTLIAKVESADRIRAAVIAQHYVSTAMEGSIPAVYGHWVGDEQGIILQEDISPATQGDELSGCTTEQAGKIVALVAKLHLSTQIEDAPADGINVFTTKISDRERWSTALTRTRERYPGLFTPDRFERLADFPAELTHSAELLESEELSWIHVDPHLDNILWRGDGSPVLIDWSNARVGPPAVDVAALLMSYSFRSDAPLEANRLIEDYARLVSTPPDQIRPAVVAALKPVFIQGGIGWAGEASNEGFPPRKADLRDEMLARSLRALDWVEFPR